MKQPVILIAEDEKNTREGLARALKRHYRVLTADNGARALTLLQEHHVDVVLSDLRMPGMDGMTLMRRALALTPRPIFILVTAYGNVENAVEAMKQGAYDYLTKPVNLDRLEMLLERSLRNREVESENRNLREQLNVKFGMESMVGEAAPMLEVFETVRQVAPSRATVLIEGESGTGKELVAHAIHRLSTRNHGPFVAVHCAALSETLLESELFGHERGAFTGATERRRGRFEAADGGTLFLDEIGEINPAIQVKLLRVLEERSFERVGGQETIETDVRVIGATNRDLRKLVAEGSFREDLYYRLYVVSIRIPPLRERPADIPLLANHYIRVYNEENGRQVEGLTPDALDLLVGYPWPGNVRELRNVIERMVVMGRGNRLTVRDLPVNVREASTGAAGRIPTGLSLEETEKQMIVRALKASEGNRTRAAEQLGISRRTLHRKLNEYGLRDPA